MSSNRSTIKNNEIDAAKKRFAVLCLGLLVVSCLWMHEGVDAQDYLSTYKRILISPSGPENYINTLAKDAKGFLWLGTNNGLFRFDGKDNDVISLTENPNQSQQINDLAIHGNILFAATQKGVVQLDLSNYQPITNPKLSHIKGEVINIIADPAYGVWWLTSDGWLYHWKNGIVGKIQLEIGERHRNGSLFFLNGNIWVTTQYKGTYIVDGHNMNIRQHLTLPALGTNEWTVKKTGNGDLHVISGIGLFQLKQTQTGYETQKRSDGFFSNFISQNNKLYSVLKGNKLAYHYDPENIQKNISIDIGADKPELINKVFVSDQQIFLATTYGFTILDFKKNEFEFIHSTYNIFNNSFEVPRGILETKDEYRLATYDGIYSYPKNQLKAEPTFKKTKFTYALLQDKDKIWMVTDGEGFKVWNKNSNTIANISINNTKDFSNFKSIAQLDENTLLLGTYHNLIRYNKQTGANNIINIRHKNWGGKENFIYGIYSTRQGIREEGQVTSDKFYLATAWGVLLADTAGKVYADYGKNLNGAQDKQAYAIWVSKDNSIWAGTGNGVYHFSTSGKILHHLTTKNGLAGDRIASITPDENNHLWVATFTGLSDINLTTLEVQNFTKADGLPDNEFNHGSSLLTSTGEIILGTVNGFIKFNPKAISQKRKSTPSLHISKMEVGNSKEVKSIFNISDMGMDTLTVDKKYNYARINLFIDPLDIFQKTSYEYKIEGIHSDWIRLGNVPIVSLDNYSKGKYPLQIRAITGEGSKNIITKSLLVVVDEYFYKTNLFYGLVFLLFFLLTLFYLLLFIKRNRKIAEVRRLIAQDLHDEVGAYLTGISMNIELMKKSRSLENNYFQTIELLGKNALLSLKDSLWSLNSKSDNARELWDRVKTLARETLDPLDIHFSFKEKEGLEKIKLSLLEKNYLLLVMKECITNAIKHGDRTAVVFEWTSMGKEQAIVITNGITGGPQSKDGQGLYNIENRMKKIGGSVSFQKGNQLFTVTIKLKYPG